ncbi:hypothetical protein GQ55_7G264300 [Panicum hallii var. hallii]|uniref:Uncharacterized protein n=1 Tax=Panicum hallii var. hallii TaxID=1504633 RepID=A0A2T7CZ98_9POAL|nr:hypothetical protein GQ55_7G264300 [Panicum hallii var. hallii]
MILTITSSRQKRTLQYGQTDTSGLATFFTCIKLESSYLIGKSSLPLPQISTLLLGRRRVPPKSRIARLHHNAAKHMYIIST